MDKFNWLAVIVMKYPQCDLIFYSSEKDQNSDNGGGCGVSMVIVDKS